MIAQADKARRRVALKRRRLSAGLTTAHLELDQRTILRTQPIAVENPLKELISGFRAIATTGTARDHIIDPRALVPVSLAIVELFLPGARIVATFPAILDRAQRTLSVGRSNRNQKE